MRTIWINATYFCCGVIVNEKGFVIDAAPIVAWAINRPYERILEFLKERNALREWKIL